MTSPARILVVDTMGGLGDLMLALPMVDALLRSHPGAETTVVTTAPWHVLLAHDERITEVVPVAGRDAESVLGTVRPVLARLHPDLAITTNRQHGLPELLEAGSGRTVTDLWRRPPADELVDRRFLRLLVEEGVVDEALLALPPRLVLTSQEVRDGSALLDALAAPAPVLLFPDSGMRVKQWPLAYWQGAVRRLHDSGRTPLVVSRVDEQRRVLRAAGATVVPDLDLRALAGLCAAVAARDGTGIGGDTGPVRLASAAGLPVVGLFGPTVASRYGYRDAAVNLQGLPECTVRTPTAITDQECWWTARCPLTESHAPRCMSVITVDAVLAAAGG